MAKVSLTLHGFDATLRALKRAPEVVKKHASKAVGLNAALVAAKARQNVPVLTGELRSAIDWEHREGTLSGSVGITSGSPARRYWYLVEFGTVHQAAQPYFRPAAEATRHGFIQDMRDIGPDVEREMGE